MPPFLEVIIDIAGLNIIGCGPDVRFRSGTRMASGLLRFVTQGAELYRFMIRRKNNMNKTDKIFVAGPKGMVGSAIMRRLEKEGFSNLVLRSSQQLDLTNQAAVEQFFADERPAYVFLAAAKVLCASIPAVSDQQR